MHSIMLSCPLAYLLGLFGALVKLTNFGQYLQRGAGRCIGFFMSHA